MSVDPQHLRMIEALLFAAVEPLDEASLAARLPDDADLPALVAALEERYANRGVNLVTVAGKWALRTAPDLAFLLERERQVTRRLSRAALETLAIIAYHQPVSRAESEEIRGGGLSRGTLELLMEAGGVRSLVSEARRKDGAKIWISESFRVARGEAGEILYFEGFVKDITDAKRAEQELAETAAQLRAALDNMRSGMKLVDRDLNYVLFNARYAELCDFPDGLVKVGGSMLDELRYQAERHVLFFTS